MQIKQESFLDILGISNTQFVVPVYQRVYSWNDRHCRALFDDVVQAGTNGTDHFTGVLLFAEDDQMWDQCGRIRIIDGQQRMTTVTLLLIAIERLLSDGAIQIAGLCAGDIRRKYLLTSDEDGAPCKLILSHLDRGTLATLVDGGRMPAEHSARLVENLQLFLDMLQEPGFDANILWKGLSSLRVISALLEDEDEPQLVFEGLNSKGVPLTAGDLVRNMLIFAPGNYNRDSLYDRYWRPMEQSLAQAQGADMDGLVRGWLSHKFKETRVRNETDVYSLLKDHVRTSEGSLEDLLEDLGRFGQHYAADAEYRSRIDRRTADWIKDKPRMGVTKIFGD